MLFTVNNVVTGSVGVGPVVIGEAQGVHFAVVAVERHLALAGVDVVGAEVLGHRQPVQAFVRKLFVQVAAERAADGA